MKTACTYVAFHHSPCLTLRKGPPRSRDDGPDGRARHLVPGRMSKIGVVLQSRFPKISQCTRKFDSRCHKLKMTWLQVPINWTLKRIPCYVMLWPEFASNHPRIPHVIYILEWCHLTSLQLDQMYGLFSSKWLSLLGNVYEILNHAYCVYNVCILMVKPWICWNFCLHLSQESQQHKNHIDILDIKKSSPNPVT